MAKGSGKARVAGRHPFPPSPTCRPLPTKRSVYSPPWNVGWTCSCLRFPLLWSSHCRHPKMPTSSHQARGAPSGFQNKTHTSYCIWWWVLRDLSPSPSISLPPHSRFLPQGLCTPCLLPRVLTSLSAGGCTLGHPGPITGALRVPHPHSATSPFSRSGVARPDFLCLHLSPGSP